MADFLELRARLESNEDVVDCLETVNTLLVADTSVSLASEILSTIPLSVLFPCLETQDPDQVSLTCTVLEKLLCHLPASDLVQHGRYIELGLQYPETRVPKTCLQLLLRLCAEDAVGELIMAPTMLHLVTLLLGGDDLQCASLAARVLLHFSTQCDVLESKLKGVWFRELESLLQGSDTVRYRVYDLVVKTCMQGGGKCLMVVSSSSGILDRLVQELETSDPLIKMNCIEMLSCLAESPTGVTFLQSKQVLDQLYRTLLGSEQDVMVTIVIPAILKFFGKLCIHLGGEAVELFNKYPQFLHLTLEAALLPGDDTLWGVSVDTFGLLSSTLSGRTLLLSQQDATEKVLQNLGELVTLSPMHIRCRSLRAVKMMVSCEEECHWELSTSQQWFAQVHQNLFKLLLSVVRQPFAELRLAGLMVVLEMSAHEWGQRVMQDCAGFLEYLLDRSTEQEREGKDLKYEVVCRITASDCGEVVWGNVNMMKIKKYDREGPYYYHAGDTTVALEGAF